MIFDETSLQTTPIDLEVVDITLNQALIAYKHISKKMEEYIKEHFKDGADTQTSFQIQKDSLLQKVNDLQKNFNETYESANLEDIKNEFFQYR